MNAGFGMYLREAVFPCSQMLVSSAALAVAALCLLASAARELPNIVVLVVDDVDLTLGSTNVCFFVFFFFLECCCLRVAVCFYCCRVMW